MDWISELAASARLFGITEEALAEKTGYPAPWIAGLLRGARRAPAGGRGQFADAVDEIVAGLLESGDI